ncbi:hypothetical protein BUALT_Bualt06G0059100 [Buddleja alternifolia]|uniref:Protein FAR1-RELATED SEQUENCE n=1 Tax=Buddleja alternifolia TaxID=168488 RepID=A0AAV6XEK1_9LAMI|nr:hypothetical protein BUALT_Bualt06G0059100 [Buddleja alternifolia]
MTDAHKAEVDMVISCGIAPSETIELMAKQVGGPEHLGFISDDCKNYLRSKRTITMRLGDTGGVLEYLQKKQAEDPNFYYAIQVDEEDLITNIFWSDAKMIVQRLFARAFSGCMYDHEDEEEFIDAWNKMIVKYSLQNNDWLQRMFQLRKKWVLVYGQETFCADMSTTQRSESMNNVIKKYVSYKTNLFEFFEHFERLLKDRRYKESRADFSTSQSSPNLSFPVQILKHASTVYISKFFELFQAELGKAHDCNLEICNEKDTMLEFKVASYGK